MRVASRGRFQAALVAAVAITGTALPVPQVAAAPVALVRGEVVTLAGTPHIWIADDQGVLHWNGDTRALAQHFVDWGARQTVSLPQLQTMPRGDPWLSAGLVKDGAPIYLAKWESDAAQPTLLHIQNIQDVELFGITAGNYGAFVADRGPWEQTVGFSVGTLPHGELGGATVAASAPAPPAASAPSVTAPVGARRAPAAATPAAPAPTPSTGGSGTGDPSGKSGGLTR